MLNSVQNVNIASNSAHKPKKSQGCEFITTDTNLIGHIQEDAFTTAQKENKKKKIAKYSIIGAVGITIAGAILGGSFLAKGSFKKISDFINKKFGAKGKNLIEDIGNASINVNNSKDAYLKKYLFNIDPSKHPKFLDKHPKLLNAYTSIKKFIAKPLKKIDEWSSNLYKKAAESTISQKYKRLGKKIQKTDSLLTETLKNVPEAELGKKITINGIEKTVSEWIDDIGVLTKKQSSTLETNFGKEARERLYAEMDKATKNVAQGFRETAEKGIKHKEHRRDLFKFIAEDTVKGEKATMASKINSRLSSLTNQANTGCSDEIGKIVDGLAENGVIDGKTHKKIASKLTDIKGKMTKNAEIIAEDAFDKFRDINMGCAPADVLMTAGEIGLLTLHASQAKNKEERTSVVLTTAVPLGLGIAGTTWATLKMISGIKSLLLGGAITLVSGIIGKSIDKIYRKNHNIEDEKPSIATLELPKEIQEGAIAKTVDRVIEKVAGQ